MTVKELADRVIELRQSAWGQTDEATVVVATQELTPDDEAVVRRVVSEAGYTGAELNEMVRQVSARVVGRVEALADNLPATGGD